MVRAKGLANTWTCTLSGGADVERVLNNWDHIVAFLVVGLLALSLATTRRRCYVVVLALLALAIVAEALDGMLVGPYCRAWDVAANLIGVTIAGTFVVATRLKLRANAH